MLQLLFSLQIKRSLEILILKKEKKYKTTCFFFQKLSWVCKAFFFKKIFYTWSSFCYSVPLFFPPNTNSNNIVLVFWMVIGSLVVVLTKSCPTLCNPMDCSLPGSSSDHGVNPTRILECVATPGVPSPGDLPDPGIEPASPAWQADS